MGPSWPDPWLCQRNVKWLQNLSCQWDVQACTSGGQEGKRGHTQGTPTPPAGHAAAWAAGTARASPQFLGTGKRGRCRSTSHCHPRSWSPCRPCRSRWPGKHVARATSVRHSASTAKLTRSGAPLQRLAQLCAAPNPPAKCWGPANGASGGSSNGGSSIQFWTPTPARCAGGCLSKTSFSGFWAIFEILHFILSICDVHIFGGKKPVPRSPSMKTK